MSIIRIMLLDDPKNQAVPPVIGGTAPVFSETNEV